MSIFCLLVLTVEEVRSQNGARLLTIEAVKLTPFCSNGYVYEFRGLTKKEKEILKTSLDVNVSFKMVIAWRFRVKAPHDKLSIQWLRQKRWKTGGQQFQNETMLKRFEKDHTIA